MPHVKINDKEIKLVETRTFYPYPDGYCGGDTVEINVFKATKKGNFTINFSSRVVKVTVI